jgi:hypothetical protein
MILFLFLKVYTRLLRFNPSIQGISAIIQNETIVESADVLRDKDNQQFYEGHRTWK